jgi:hypothetical protein
MEPMLLERAAMAIEIAIGRLMACCIHPAAAWQRLRTPGRAILVGTYFGASYLMALAALFIA